MVTATLDWVNPTTRTDGSPITTASIAQTKIFDTAAGVPGNQIGSTQAGGTNFQTGPLPNATHTFTVSVVDTTGQESAMSSPATVIINVPAPNPATGLTVTSVNP